MKKMRFVLTLMFVLLTSSLVAQNRLLGAKFTFGPKVAFTMTELSFNKDFTSNFQSGFDAGLFFRFGSRFHFQPEIYYSFQDCTSFPNVISNLQENLAIKTHYIQMPLLFGVSAINRTHFKLRVFVGPKVGYLLKTDEGIHLLDNSNQELLSDFIFGGLVGVGFDIWRFTLDAGYNFLFSENLNVNSLVPESYLKTNMFSFTIGFKCF